MKTLLIAFCDSPVYNKFSDYFFQPFNNFAKQNMINPKVKPD